MCHACSEYGQYFHFTLFWAQMSEQLLVCNLGSPIKWLCTSDLIWLQAWGRVMILMVVVLETVRMLIVTVGVLSYCLYRSPRPPDLICYGE